MSAALHIDSVALPRKKIHMSCHDSVTKVVAILWIQIGKLETSEAGTCFHRGTFEKAILQTYSTD
jgi:hypothetical protein